MSDINTPQVRERISNLIHEKLGALVAPEVGVDLAGALFVLLNQASAEAVPTGGPVIAAAAGDLADEPIRWAAHQLDDNGAARTSELAGETIDAGWYVSACFDDDDVLATLQVHHAVTPDGAEDTEGVARRLATLLNQRAPRVWREGDDIPADTWVLDDDGHVGQVDEDLHPGELVRCWLGTVVEVVLPDYDAAVTADQEARR